jgi:hypothetical protein
MLFKLFLCEKWLNDIVFWQKYLALHAGKNFVEWAKVDKGCR